MEPATYRQRLTPLGYIGIALGIAAPAAAGYTAMEFYEAMVTRNQFAAMPRSPIPDVAILTVVGVIGWVMVLIGREHYPYTDPDQSGTTKP